MEQKLQVIFQKRKKFLKNQIDKQKQQNLPKIRWVFKWSLKEQIK